MTLMFDDQGQLIGRFGNHKLNLGQVPNDSREVETLVAQEHILYSLAYNRRLELFGPFSDRGTFGALNTAIHIFIAGLSEHDRTELLSPYKGNMDSAAILVGEAVSDIERRLGNQ